MNKVFIGIFFLITSVSFSQAGGEDVFSFLNLPTGPKQIALGGTALVVENDVSQVLWNPSIATDKIDQKVGLNYVSYVQGIKVGSVVYAEQLPKKWGVVMGGIQYLDYGKNDKTEAYSSTVVGQWKAMDLSVNLGYAIQFKNVSGGIMFKYINSTIDTYSADAFAYDLSLSYKAFQKSVLVALALRNNSSQEIRYLDEVYYLSPKLSLSASYKLAHVPLKLYGTLDEINHWNISAPNPSNEIVDLEGNITPESVSQFNNALRHLTVGAELWPDKKINLRMGYNFRKAIEYQLKEVRTNAGLSYGIGFHTKKIGLDYAYAKFQEGAKYNTFGLTIQL